MSQIDWSKAPEGATHYSPSCEDYYPCWCKWVDGRLFGWLSDGDSNWTRICSQEQNQEKIKAMIARPTVEKWTGEGLPPVGTVCELRVKGYGDWSSAQIIYMSETGCLWVPYGAQSESFNAPYNMEFRPIRTPEQIAAEEREKDSFELFSTINWNDSREQWDRMSESRKDDYRKAIDAGYRKFEILEN